MYRFIYTQLSKQGYIVTTVATNQDGDYSAVGAFDCHRTGQWTAVQHSEQLGLHDMGWNPGKPWKRNTKQWRFPSK
jgi:hypothetical protein